MSRLHDRIMEVGVRLNGQHSTVGDDFRDAVVVDVSNVAATIDLDEVVNWQPSDFPCVAPSWPLAFLEWPGLLGTRLGALISWHDLQGLDLSAHPLGFTTYECERSRWLMQTKLFVEYAKRRVAGPIVDLCLLVDGAGKMVNRDADTEKPNLLLDKTTTELEDVVKIEGVVSSLAPAFLGISFTHCKNVERVLNEPSPKVDAKHRRRHGRGLTRYYTLHIGPMKEVLRREGHADEQGLKRALHICRGHFATYSDDKPLFGKYVGTFWKPMHVRGKKEVGEVIKDYQVHPPDEGSSRAAASDKSIVPRSNE